ncbi:hypothetical protein M501DRAFT_987405 [Patellaria atrata CBS 101060]|uniref:Splicing factor U2AF subunit n=1 Tax=Patellaria atrata CBS 101060 TaxID=1346257 RepID=A0A9P4VKC6_9PEZI|nr:hypothetical protein M501DRAFT_987405 [Patellaria atrata CBS 101060]
MDPHEITSPDAEIEMSAETGTEIENEIVAIAVPDVVDRGPQPIEVHAVSRDRREERTGTWDKDRASARRDARREEEGPSRRDRGDLFDDRGGRARRDRDILGGPGRAERKKSASPPPKKKEPTPDLTDVLSVLERRRRLTQWDIKPPGYEKVTAEQAKLSGMFPLPGAPRQQPMDPSRLQAFMNQPAGAASSSTLKPSNARQAKRLFVHNIPASATADSIQQFFNLQLNGLNVVSGIDPCVSAFLSEDRKYALLDFKTAEDATVAMAFDGITMEDDDNMMTSNGTNSPDRSGLSIRRPKDYIVPAAPSEDEEAEGNVSSVVRDSPNKISVTRIPVYLTDEQVTELLTSFGELKSFVLVKDADTEQSRGIAFCEYLDPSTTEIAVEGLDNMELGEDKIRVKRASIGVQQAGGLEMNINAMSLLAGTSTGELEQSRVIQLMNMVTMEELMDGEEYEDILQDVQDECGKYGKILEIKVPRPTAGRPAPGVGKIFVKFESASSAQKAMASLAGRKFADRTVIVTPFGEEYFDVNAW